MKQMIRAMLIIAILCLPVMVFADSVSLPALTVSKAPQGGETYSLTMQVLIAMTLFTLIPAILMLMTSFTRIIIVLGMLRQAIGMPAIPTNQILIGISLFLTLFIMAPVFSKMNETAIKPYLDKKISMNVALERAQKPFRVFMLNQTRTNDLDMFANLAGIKTIEDVNKLPLTVIMPAFVISELKTAFQIGFLLFIPFLIIDLIVASVLMSMGMMMLSPIIISLPFKIMLFVLVDGWSLVIGTLVTSFGVT